MTTPPCSAITKSGQICGRTTGTQPDPDTGQPRCYSHIAKARRLAKPGSRPPVRTPKSPEDVKALAAWVMIQAATNQLSAPSSNAVARAAQLWLTAHRDKVQEASNAILTLAASVLDMGATWIVPAAEQPRYNAAMARLQNAWDMLTALQPERETALEATQRARRQRDRAQEQEDNMDDALERDDAP